MSTIKLLCKSEYRNATEHYKAGAVIEVSEQKAAWLMNDAPGVFESYQKPAEKITAVDAPPMDKMIRRPKVKK